MTTANARSARRLHSEPLSTCYLNSLEVSFDQSCVHGLFKCNSKRLTFRQIDSVNLARVVCKLWPDNLVSWFPLPSDFFDDSSLLFLDVLEARLSINMLQLLVCALLMRLARFKSGKGFLQLTDKVVETATLCT
jgi:hypothetical protein